MPAPYGPPAACNGPQPGSAEPTLRPARGLSTRLARGLVVPFIVLSLLLAACGGSDSTADEGFRAADGEDGGALADEPSSSDDQASGSGDDDGEMAGIGDSSAADGTGADGTADAGDTAPTPTPAGGTSGSGLDPDAGAGTALVAPYDQAQALARNLFNFDPEPAGVECIVEASADLPGLAETMAAGTAYVRDLSDGQLRDVSFGVNGCVDPIAVGDWVTSAVTPGDPSIQKSAPTCFAERFSDPESGDELFHTFVAVAFQYRYEPASADALTQVLSDCTPVRALAGFLAADYEGAAADGIAVDLECADVALGDPELSLRFWRTLIDGFQPPTTVIAPALESCAVDLFEGMATTVPTDFVAWSGTGALGDVVPTARNGIYEEPPPMLIDTTASYAAVINTGGGEIHLALFADEAPVTVNNFVALARDGFYDRVSFHRVIDDFMAQGGDPTGTGTGGPGYAFIDEIDPDRLFDQAGLLAMANSGPATNGSQFFITFGPTDWLDGNHTIFGEVVSGQEVVDAITRAEPGAGRGQIIDSIRIIEG